MGRIWFQQDGATCHTACATNKLLQEKLVSSFQHRHICTPIGYTYYVL